MKQPFHFLLSGLLAALAGAAVLSCKDSSGGSPAAAGDALKQETTTATLPDEDPDHPVWITEVQEKVLAAVEDGRLAEAAAELEKLLAAHPDIPAEDRVRLKLFITLEEHISREDAAAGMMAVDDALAKHPESGLRDEEEQIKRMVRTRIDTKQADNAMSGLAALVENKEDAPKLRAAAEEAFAKQPKMSQNAKSIVLFRLLVEPLVDAADEAGALRELDALAAAYPESDFAKDAEGFREDMLERIAEERVEKVMDALAPLIEEGDPAKIKEGAEKHFAAHPELKADDRAGILFQILVLPQVMAGETESALAELDALVKAYPDTELARAADDIRSSLHDTMELDALLGEDDAFVEPPPPAFPSVVEP